MSVIKHTASHFGKCAFLLCLDPTLGGLATSAATVTIVGSLWDIGKDIVFSNSGKKQALEKEFETRLKAAKKKFKDDALWEIGLSQSMIAIDVFAPGERAFRKLVQSGSGEGMLQIAQSRKNAKSLKEVIQFGDPKIKKACEIALDVFLQVCREDEAIIRDLQAAALNDIEGKIDRLTQLGSDAHKALDEYKRLRVFSRLSNNSQELDLSYQAPTNILKAQYEVVPMFGREEELGDLAGWCEADRPVGLRTYFGEAGTGKTRLMIEAIRRQNRLEFADGADGWACGFLPMGDDKFTADELRTLMLSDRKLFLVADYADADPEYVNLLFNIWQNCKPEKLRVVLLSRKDGLWRTSSLNSFVSGFFDTKAGELIDLQPLTLGEDQRKEYLKECITSFADVLGNTVDHTIQADLISDEFQNALLVAMKAYAICFGEEITEVDKLFDYVLRREQDFWKELGAKNGIKGQALETLHLLVTLVTLHSGADNRQQLKQLSNKALEFTNRDEPSSDALSDMVHKLYPPNQPEAYSAAMEPDRVGEYMVQQKLAEKPELLKLAFTEADENLKLKIHGFFDRIRQADNLKNLHMMLTLYGNLPHQTVALSEFAEWITNTLNVMLSQVDLENADEDIQNLRAGLLNNLANRLSGLGRREEALDAVQQAVELYKKLVETRPDAFTPDLARSLNNLASFLSGLGKREEALDAAQQAVELYKKLVETRPDAFTPDLAGSLNNLASFLSDIGKREEALDAAQQAVGLYKKLAEKNPDALTPDLARSLNNLASRLSDLGRREEALDAAQQAVELYQKLAEKNPDALTPDLARSLNNLASRLSDLGRHEEALNAAQQAVELRRKLVETRPDAFTPDLARSLNNLANCLSGLGRREEALDAAQQAVKLYKKLAETRPDAFTPDLAGSLNNLANCLSDLGRREDALDAAQQAVELRRKLAETRPDAFTPDLATSLNNLATRLSDLGRREEALETAQQAVELRKKLAETRPDAFTPDLALSLGALGQVYNGMERFEEAANSFHEGLSLLLPYLEQLPQAYAGLMMGLSREYVQACENAGQELDEEKLSKVFTILAEAGLIELPETDDE